MDDHLIINLRVADTLYPLKIKRREEETFRKAAKEIDYKLSQYKKYFADNSSSLNDVHYMAMTAIQAVAGTTGQELRANEFEERIKALTLELDTF